MVTTIKSLFAAAVLLTAAASWAMAVEPLVDRPEALSAAFSRLEQKVRSQPLEYPAGRLEDTRRFAHEALNRVASLIRSGAIDSRIPWTIALNPPALGVEIDRRPLLPSRFLAYVTLLHRNEPGIEHPTVLALRAGITELLWAHYFSNRVTNFQSAYLQKVQILQDCLHSQVNDDPRKRQKVQDALIWLEHTGLENELMARVRKRFTWPNIRIVIKRNLLNGLISPISDFANSQNLTDLILGNPVHTALTTQAQVQTALVPNATAIQIDVVARSHSQGRSVALGRATVYSSSTTEAHVRKPLLISPTGINGDWPPAVTVQVNSTIDDVAVSSRFFRGIATQVAWNQVMSMKGAADASAERLAQQRAAEQLDKQLRPLVRDFNRTYRERIVLPATRIGYWPGNLAFRSSAEDVELTGIFAPEEELGSSQSFPPVSGRHLIEVAIHESVVNNLSLASIGAFTNTVQDDQIEQAISLLTGRVPRGLRVFTGSTRWRVAFPRHPVRVKFEHGKIRLSVKINRFDIQRVPVQADLSVCCTYLPRVTKFGPVFERRGRVAGFGEGKQLSVEQTAFIRDKMNALFPASIRFDGLILPIGGSLNQLAGLKLTDMKCDGGVLAFGYD